ncbi:MAG: tRNA (adenosine(37)-N6)-threonylcarbamoyltransferase complex ATPase subunit type 1 TsaE [Candidatus Helarchaeota archaeon]|nr:tRNA (adenosine(37)-N6)-threonylcarbamoyltransferase complex ATPase subunit type 1 TsaE [Candidatus Helarchaeota archaeon]
MFETITQKPLQTYNLGIELSKKLKIGDVVAFYGGLGVGKTCFIKGICRGLGVKDNVISPSFTIINEYIGNFKVYHIDFYRIEKIDELRELGLEEYLYDDGICLIEWADKVEFLLPQNRINIKMDFINGKKSWRKVRIER